MRKNGALRKNCAKVAQKLLLDGIYICCALRAYLRDYMRGFKKPPRNNHSSEYPVKQIYKRRTMMPTIKEYTDNYVRWREMLLQNAERIARSSEVRTALNKDADSAPLDELLIMAVNCIADLTNDEAFRTQVIEKIERRSDGD